MSKAEEKFIEELNKEHEIILGFQEYEKQIADLEAKLAESEEKYKKAYREGLLQKQFDKDMEIEQLKQQLADSKEQLNNSEQKCLICNKCQENEQLKKQLEEKEKIEFTDTINFVETSEPDRVAEYIDELLEKLAQAQKTIEIQNKLTDVLIEENLDYSYDLTDIAHERAEELAESWEEDYQQEIEQLKQQLAEKDRQIVILEKANEYLEDIQAPLVVVEYIDNQIKQLKEGK